MSHSLKAVIVAVIAFNLQAAPATANVVIDNIELGDSELDSAMTPVTSVSERATGELDEFQRKDPSEGWSLDPVKNGRNGSEGRGRKAAGNRQLRYPKSNRSSGGNAGGGGGGGGSRSARRGPRRQDGGREIIQTVVVGEDNAEPAPEAQELDVDLATMDSGLNTPGQGGSGGGGGSVALSDPTEDGNTSLGSSGAGSPGGLGTVVSGTPEPSAIMVWAIAGCCGYGLLRHQKKKVA